MSDVVYFLSARNPKPHLVLVPDRESLCKVFFFFSPLRNDDIPSLLRGYSLPVYVLACIFLSNYCQAIYCPDEKSSPRRDDEYHGQCIIQ